MIFPEWLSDVFPWCSAPCCCCWTLVAGADRPMGRCFWELALPCVLMKLLYNFVWTNIYGRALCASVPPWSPWAFSGSSVCTECHQIKHWAWRQCKLSLVQWFGAAGSGFCVAARRFCFLFLCLCYDQYSGFSSVPLSPPLERVLLAGQRWRLFSTNSSFSLSAHQVAMKISWHWLCPLHWRPTEEIHAEIYKYHAWACTRSCGAF